MPIEADPRAQKIPASCARMCRIRFGRQIEHLVVSSEEPRTPNNRLFAINLTEAMMRETMGGCVGTHGWSARPASGCCCRRSCSRPTETGTGAGTTTMTQAIRRELRSTCANDDSNRRSWSRGVRTGGCGRSTPHRRMGAGPWQSRRPDRE